MTLKLYWEDSKLTEFKAAVAGVIEGEGRRGIVLDRTAFYPTGGGQPSDLGSLGTLDVVEVELLDDGRIVHWIRGDGGIFAGEVLDCRVDAGRRREMTQQHTGQHIISQAFFQLFGAETRGFRITDRSTEIDLALEARPGELEDFIARAEDLANAVVFEDREIRIHQVSPEEAARLPLRKESFVTDCVRVVEIDDFDWSPCGGTHAGRTGEVGLITVRSWERAKKMTRVHFLCGGRALRDYRAAARISDSIARKLSVGRDETESAVDRLIEESKSRTRRIRELVGITADIEAGELLESAISAGGCRAVEAVFEARDFEELKMLAHRIAQRPGSIALLASVEAGSARLVFARSADAQADMNSLMKFAAGRLGGRGGGTPDFAQGGGIAVPDLAEILKAARDMALGGQLTS